MGQTLNFSIPEDTILQKLILYKKTNRHKSEIPLDTFVIVSVTQPSALSNIKYKYLPEYNYIEGEVSRRFFALAQNDGFS